MKPRFDVILFDLDDTLYDAERAYRLPMKSIGLSMKSAAYAAARARVKGRLESRHPSARNRLLYFKEMLASSGRYSPERALALMGRYEAALFRQVRSQWIRLKRSKLLQKLSRRYRLAVLSNENLRTQLIKMKAIDPKSRFFKLLITSEEVGAEKPSPRMFKETLRLLKVSPKRCLMVGNDFSSDLRPALSLGMKGVLTREFSLPGTRSKVPRTIPILDRLEHLPTLLPD